MIKSAIKGSTPLKTSGFVEIAVASSVLGAPINVFFEIYCSFYSSIEVFLGVDVFPPSLSVTGVITMDVTSDIIGVFLCSSIILLASSKILCAPILSVV
jgi:hypothetical protein